MSCPRSDIQALGNEGGCSWSSPHEAVSNRVRTDPHHMNKTTGHIIRMIGMLIEMIGVWGVYQASNSKESLGHLDTWRRHHAGRLAGRLRRPDHLARRRVYCLLP